eukprot:CAMPEP_0119081958 /NCGR_PEP_ID=MMETSP1178-20130426/119102_1 /TAXON_ID=33656 /ORGANISM="unid sp, Strain CCMP2000" /LENGTH=141 /DNA_ID=CAMNT_0007064697 /DNA_START=32 /DNA_END=457 /DNA_ORIENTATION=-
MAVDPTMAMDERAEEEDRLRAKWSKPRAAATEQGSANEPTPAVSKDQRARINAGLDKLNSVKMCMQCQAQGIVKRQYGHRVMDEVCGACDGEGCIVTRPPSTAEKIARVEALVAGATNLECLQRYEDALRTGNLDDVLNST